jgi:hypothetical protein
MARIPMRAVKDFWELRSPEQDMNERGDSTASAAVLDRGKSIGEK